MPIWYSRPLLKLEAEELGSSIEFDEEHMGDALEIAEKLENQLKSLYAAMRDGSYAFGEQDLEFMTIVNTNPVSGFPLNRC